MAKSKCGLSARSTNNRHSTVHIHTQPSQSIYIFYNIRIRGDAVAYTQFISHHSHKGCSICCAVYNTHTNRWFSFECVRSIFDYLNFHKKKGKREKENRERGKWQKTKLKMCSVWYWCVNVSFVSAHRHRIILYLQCFPCSITKRCTNSISIEFATNFYYFILNFCCLVLVFQVSKFERFQLRNSFEKIYITTPLIGVTCK